MTEKEQPISLEKSESEEVKAMRFLAARGDLGRWLRINSKNHECSQNVVTTFCGDYCIKCGKPTPSNDHPISVIEEIEK